jgi:hypothetical protein
MSNEKRRAHLDLRKVDIALDILQLTLAQSSIWPCRVIPVENVGGNVGVLESVGLGDETASVRKASHDENGFVTVLDGERTEDGMTLYDLVLGDLVQTRSAITSSKGEDRNGAP